MAVPGSLAERLLYGDDALAASIAAALIVPERNNFVERPWGGTAMRRFKRLCELPEQPASTGLGLGEAFEIAAFDADPEAARFPSRVRFADGSMLTLPELLGRHGRRLLGEAFVAEHGACFPLLPKTVDIRELLSVQGHPAGHTEVYVVIDAEPGATIRLGFKADIDATKLRAELLQGLELQRELLGLLGPDADPLKLQTVLGPWLANRPAPLAALEPALRDDLPTDAAWPAVGQLSNALKALYWRVLDTLNAIPVAPGQVMHNATPARLLAGTGRPPSAEVHALGNPEGREIVALEIRRPGPTFRAWDNVRFPIRDVDVDRALAVLNLRATSAADFVVEPAAVPGRPGVYLAVDSAYFRVEHLRLDAHTVAAVPAEGPHSLHVIEGAVAVVAEDGREVGRLARGESALVPVGVGGYRVHADARAEIVKASLPPSSRRRLL